MSRKNQIPGLTSHPLADGALMYHWQPSPRLRREGWTNLTLGRDFTAACAAAIARNGDVADHRQRGPMAPAAPRIRTVGEGIAAYRADPAFTLLKPKTRAEYGTRLRQLALWADEGRLPIRHLTRDHCVALRNALVRDPRAHRTAAILRVLRLLCRFFVSQGWLTANPAAALDVPEPASRTHRIDIGQLGPLLAAADRLGLPHVALGITLGFFTLQREGDLLATTAFRFREVDDISAEARRALAGPDGRVLGLWLQQGKTGAQVAVPLIPASRTAVEAAIEAARDVKSNDAALFQKAGRRVQEKTLQRDFRAVATEAARAAAEAADAPLAETYAKLQFRDLRRSGMCWLRFNSVPVAMIASLSGHSIDKTMKILDTYMPRDTRAAAEGMAIAVTRQAQRDAAAAEQEGGAAI